MIEGFVDLVRPFLVRGWAADREHPNERVNIELKIHGRLVGTAVADEFRQDLHDQGIGDGHHAFVVRVSSEIPEDAVNSISVTGASTWHDRTQLPIALGADVQLGRPDLKVFIVGVARSGTSALWDATRQVFRLQGHGESHVVPALQKAIHPLRKYFEKLDDNQDPLDSQDILARQFDFRNRIEETLFGYVREFYVDAYEGASWIDKTPSDDAVQAAPLIEALFPDARLIVTKRTGIEVVRSQLKKFGSDFEDVCEMWTQGMKELIKVRSECRNVIEVDQFDLASNPRAVAKVVATHLGKPEYAEALGEILADRKENNFSAHPGQRATLDDVDWTEEQKEMFFNICGYMMVKFGYPIFGSR